MSNIVAEVSTPDVLRQLNQAFPERYPFLLQSTASGDSLGRFDILFAFPGAALVLERPGRLTGEWAGEHTEFLPALDAWWQEERVASQQHDLPYLGGWFLYLGYELAGEIEATLALHDDPALPTAFAVRCPVALIYDHVAAACYSVSEVDDPAADEQLQADIEGLETTRSESAAPPLSVREQNPDDFMNAVVAAKRHIAAGDVYQANLSREWCARTSAELDSCRIYATLCDKNPGPFAGIARWRDVSIISSSPERLVCVRDGMIATRPIAGTRPRGDTAVSDDDLSVELFANAKERAEHVMLIDLERNDLGRVCVPGTVEVDEMMVLESYAHVHHIVSNVRGQIREDVTPGAAIGAVFPGGTITGCPKVRCMEIINELESEPRGAYTGSFGYLNRDGSLDLNILIRTFVKQGDTVTFRAGAGIVADSEPHAELMETRAKAEGLLRALQDG